MELLPAIVGLAVVDSINPSALRDRLGGAAREGMLWLLGLVGFFLLADALAHVGRTR
jgi:hypothetical protein